METYGLAAGHQGVLWRLGQPSPSEGRAPGLAGGLYGSTLSWNGFWLLPFFPRGIIASGSVARDLHTTPS